VFVRSWDGKVPRPSPQVPQPSVKPRSISQLPGSWTRDGRRSLVNRLLDQPSEAVEILVNGLPPRP
jgi:hypothetical protein